MRRTFWILTLLVIAGCQSTSVPAGRPIFLPKTAELTDIEAPAVARDYGNKLTF